ncbi:hypothetical protein K0M31_020298 [Melipona bicolor]|uniref:Uncharacterized protein n=1 Tax=Melipona bicolor TaxID=60889 RepID=A0AA40G295_9HYME|nr:hypothetical protein K0M31_020298 [Melipona bicolor]
MADHKQGDGKGETLAVANSNKNNQYVDCCLGYARYITSRRLAKHGATEQRLPSFPCGGKKEIVHAKTGSYAGSIKSKFGQHETGKVNLNATNFLAPINHPRRTNGDAIPITARFAWFALYITVRLTTTFVSVRLVRELLLQVSRLARFASLCNLETSGDVLLSRNSCRPNGGQVNAINRKRN